MDFQLWYDLSYDDSVHNHHFRTVLLMHSYYPVCLTWNVITMSCFSTCYHCLQSLFSVRYYSFDDVLVGRVGLQVITLSLRWCCIPDLHGHCYTDTVLIILDNDLIMTWWFLLLLPIMDYEYLSCQLRRCFLHDVVVMSSSTLLLMLSSFAVPPGDVAVVEVMICCVRAPVQLFADEHLLRRWWISRLQPLMPSELDKQFVSDKWTLEDDDDPDDSSLPDLTLYFTIMHIVLLCCCVRTSCLSVCHPVHCRTADLCIYSAFNQHLSCI